MPIENALTIYTDGSSSSKPRSGGIGIRFVLIDDLGNETIKDAEEIGYKGATNNQMEIMACIITLRKAEGLNYYNNVQQVIIYSDSLYVVDNYKNAMFRWWKTKWLGSNGRPIENAEYWKDLIKEIKKIRIHFEIKWIKGHAKSEHNRAVDGLARRSAKRPFRKLVTRVSVRRKISKETVEIGSVCMVGQLLTIHIISCQYLRVQGMWKYKYEVMSINSKYYRKVDIIFSDIPIRDGHIYYVRMNKEPNNPRILKVIREIEK